MDMELDLDLLPTPLQVVMGSLGQLDRSMNRSKLSYNELVSD
uniref:Uncharacterized protein n=1 Tax=Picea glauca TaxID=3330 RepID=A0A101LVR4_PICGL|nr:hypothetical protein ABT39_MTgene1765 [Picea glauca]QHR88399.1 hypothetical protein Q903MT_gene2412 [Picea sitchensis]